MTSEFISRFIVFCCSLFISSASIAVVNGTQAKSTEPINASIVSIQVGDQFACTGVLIRSDVVLTASHCPGVYGPSGNVRIRSIDSECASGHFDEVAYAPTAKAYEYQDQSEGVRFPDVALLHLNSQICGKPARLAKTNPKVGDVLVGAGFGKGTPNSDFPSRINLKIIGSDILKIIQIYADIDVEATENQQLIRGVYNQLTLSKGSTVEALPTVAGQSLCGGDSGGPLYRNLKDEVEVVGIISAAYPHPEKGAVDCNRRYLQVLVPVATQLPWIEKQLKLWNP